MKTKDIGECSKHGEYFKDAPDSPCPSCEDDQGKTITFEMCLSLENLIDCANIDGLNDMAQDHWDAQGKETMLSDIEYAPLRIEEDKSIVIQVTASEEKI